MLTPETFDRVIAARGEAARPVRGEHRLFPANNRLWVFNRHLGFGFYIREADAHNACELHWLGMEAEAGRDIKAYFVDGKVDVDKLAAAVIEHAKEGT